LDAEGIRVLLRDIFGAAGGLHDDWPTRDRGMLEQRRTAALLTLRVLRSSSWTAFRPHGSPRH